MPGPARSGAHSLATPRPFPGPPRRGVSTSGPPGAAERNGLPGVCPTSALGTALGAAVGQQQSPCLWPPAHTNTLSAAPQDRVCARPVPSWAGCRSAHGLPQQAGSRARSPRCREAALPPAGDTRAPGRGGLSSKCRCGPTGHQDGQRWGQAPAGPPHWSPAATAMKCHKLTHVLQAGAWTVPESHGRSRLWPLRTVGGDGTGPPGRRTAEAEGRAGHGAASSGRPSRQRLVGERGPHS